MTRLFLDLDGVMTDLEGDYLRRFGHAMDEAESKAKMWSSIYSIEDYFYHLPPLDGALDFYKKIKGIHFPIILTACPTSRYHEVADQKKRWVKKYLGTTALVLPAHGSESKKAYIQDDGDILIDDYGKNCREWEENGGIAVQHRGTDFDRTYRLLKHGKLLALTVGQEGRQRQGTFGFAWR